MPEMTPEAIALLNAFQAARGPLIERLFDEGWTSSQIAKELSLDPDQPAAMRRGLAAMRAADQKKAP